MVYAANGVRNLFFLPTVLSAVTTFDNILQEDETFAERFLGSSYSMPTPRPTKLCHDDKHFKMDVSGRTIDCDYVRFSVYKGLICDITAEYKGGNSRIAQICPEACDNDCSPTRSPISSCRDMEDFSTKMDGKTVTCDYVRFSPDSTWSELCYREVDYNGSRKPIRQLCPMACLYDCSPTMSPTTQPPTRPPVTPETNPPTPSPTKPPTPSPTRPPVTPKTDPPTTPPPTSCKPPYTIEQRIEMLKERYRNACDTEPNDDLRKLAFDYVLELSEEDCPPDDPMDLQRYVMALYYYSTNGDNWDDKGNYLDQNLDECDWLGLTCDVTIDGERKITQITHDENNLTGTLPPELGCLPELVVFQADDNKLTGPVPDTLTNNLKLERVDLDNNLLTGTIPQQIGKLQNLIIWDTDDNLMTGSIPDSIFSIGTLQALDINSNKLTGSLSPSFSRLKNLKVLQCDDNLFTGVVPPSMRLLSNLNQFILFNNDIEGTMPSGVCDLRNGSLKILDADCAGNPPEIVCNCCTQCKSETRKRKEDSILQNSYSVD